MVTTCFSRFRPLDRGLRSATPARGRCPYLEHDTLAELFRTNPRLAAEVVTHLGVDLPTWHQARAEPADLPELTPADTARTIDDLFDEATA